MANPVKGAEENPREPCGSRVGSSNPRAATPPCCERSIVSVTSDSWHEREVLCWFVSKGIGSECMECSEVAELGDTMADRGC